MIQIKDVAKHNMKWRDIDTEGWQAENRVVWRSTIKLQHRTVCVESTQTVKREH